MQKARQTLMQVGTIVLAVNGVLWFLSGVRDDGPITFGQLLFRVGVFLLGLLLVGAAGVLMLVEKLRRPGETTSTTGPQVIEESELIVDKSDQSDEATG